MRQPLNLFPNWFIVVIALLMGLMTYQCDRQQPKTRTRIDFSVQIVQE